MTNQKLRAGIDESASAWGSPTCDYVEKKHLNSPFHCPIHSHSSSLSLHPPLSFFFVLFPFYPGYQILYESYLIPPWLASVFSRWHCSPSRPSSAVVSQLYVANCSFAVILGQLSYSHKVTTSRTLPIMRRTSLRSPSSLCRRRLRSLPLRSSALSSSTVAQHRH
jgi:hypothetical protein